MKKIFVSFIGLLGCTGLFAQYGYDAGEFDALKYSKTDISGTARYMSMGGAFGALGGDASSISLNPAGLGVYRSSELSATLGLNHTTTSSDWNGKNGNDDKYSVPFNNLTYVIGSKNDGNDIVSNFSFSFNRLKNFNRNIYAKGGAQTTSLANYLAGFTSGLSGSQLSSNEAYSNIQLPWLSILGYEGYLINPTSSGATTWGSTTTGGSVSPIYSLSEEGYINEWNFSYAANIRNKLYFGASLGIQDLKYDATTRYTEVFSNGYGFTLTNYNHTTGTGINLKLGTIYRPVDNLRLGFSISTPTFMSLTTTASATIAASTDSATVSPTTSTKATTPDSHSSDYEVQGPVQYNFSAAYIFGKYGLISADYGLADYSSMKLRDDDGNSDSYTYENEGISNYLKMVQTLRIGAEYKLNDNFSIRGGYALATSSVDDNAIKLLRWNTTVTDPSYMIDKQTNYYSVGFGYHESGWFLDFAYQLKVSKEDLYAFGTSTDTSLSATSSDRYAYTGSTINPAKITTKVNNFIVTLGFKF